MDKDTLKCARVVTGARNDDVRRNARSPDRCKQIFTRTDGVKRNRCKYFSCSEFWITTHHIHRNLQVTGSIRFLVLLCLLSITLATGSNPDQNLQTSTASGHMGITFNTLHNVSAMNTINDASVLNPDTKDQSTISAKSMTSSAGWSSCPASCFCDASTKTINCNAKRTNRIPRNIAWDVRHLNLSKCNQVVIQGNTKQNGAKAIYSEETTTQEAVLHNNLNNPTIQAAVGELDIGGIKNLRHLQTLDLGCNNLMDLQFELLPANITQLYLSNNAFRELNLRYLLSVLTQLELLDLSGNHLHKLLAPAALDRDVTSLASDDSHLQDNRTQMVANVHSSIRSLKLSGNRISRIDSSLFANLPSLSYLDLSSNRIEILQRHLFANCSNLTYLNLARNPISNLASNSFEGLFNLRQLQLSGLQVTSIHRNTFNGLGNLLILNLSNNVLLETIHADAFNHLANLETLDLTNGKLQTIYKPIFDALHSQIRLGGNPWKCDCNIYWLSANRNITLLDSPTCFEPANLMGLNLLDVASNISCTPAFIVDVTERAYFKVGSMAILDCVAVGHPSPTITWTTPKNKVFHYNPAFVNHELSQPNDALYHQGHYWHGGLHYGAESGSKRLHLLPNGSLFIDYVTRGDAGKYRCSVGNLYGNDSAIVQITLDFTGLFATILWTQVVGACAAASFLVFGILLGIIRNIVSWFQIKHQEDANRKIKSMLHSISDYKTAQFDRFSAYKADKMGKLSAFKNSKLDKFHSLSFTRPNMESALQHMQSMREHYSDQIDVIRENCSEKAERLRENYTLRLQRFRDYRSNKVGKFRGYKSDKIERLRENYNHQAQKIRDYGSQQMAKLRRSYKLQQHYLLKLYELLDIGNCMTVIEAECMRTESMLFDDNFMTLDLEAHPVHIPIHLLGDSDNDDDSYYVTASSQSDVSVNICLQSDTVKDESFGESVSDDLGQEEISFNDLQIQPYPPYLNFLESIEIESQKPSKPKLDLKLRKQKKSKKAPKEQKIVEDATHKLSLRKKNPKSAERRARTKARLSQGPDTDSENESAVLRTETERASPRKPKHRARQTFENPQAVLRHNQIQGSNLLHPLILRVENLRNDDDTSVYESAHASREQTPKLRGDKTPNMSQQFTFQTSEQILHPQHQSFIQTQPYSHLYELSYHSSEDRPVVVHRDNVDTSTHGIEGTHRQTSVQTEAINYTDESEKEPQSEETKQAKSPQFETTV